MSTVYPRKCEVWVNVETGGGILIPEDVRDEVFNAHKKYKIEELGSFYAQDRIDMFTKFYKMMGQEPPKTISVVINSSDRVSADIEKNKSSFSTNTKSTSYTTSKVPMYKVLKHVIENFSDSQRYKKNRSLVSEWGYPKDI